MNMGRTILFLICLIGIAVLGAPVQASLISTVNTDFGLVPDTGSPGAVNLEANPWTVSFDAGATADKLIVTLSSESSAGTASITYDGAPLQQVPSTTGSRNVGIWYLDNPSTSGPADLTFDMTDYNVVNGIGFGIISVSGAAPGVDVGNSAPGLSVSLTPTVANSFVVTNFGSNGAQNITGPAGHTLLYQGNIGSARGATSYLEAAPSGLQTFTFAQASAVDHSTSAAAFSPAIPEPSTFALLTAGFFLLLHRRHKRG